MVTDEMTFYYQLPLLEPDQINQVAEMLHGASTDGTTITVPNDNFYNVQGAAWLVCGHHDTIVMEWDAQDLVGDREAISSHTSWL